MDNLPDPMTITTANDGLRTLLGVAMGATQAGDAMDMTAIKIVIESLRSGLQAHPAMQARSPVTRYLALTVTALEEAEGWIHKAQMEE